MSYFQRKLFGFELPKKISSNSFDEFCKKDLIFNKYYKQLGGIYILDCDDYEQYNLLNKLFKRSYCLFSVYSRKKQFSFNNNFVTDFLIKKKNIYLRVSRSLPIDESNDIVRLTKENCKILGIEEGDKIIIKSAFSKVSAKILYFEDVDLFIKEVNILDEHDLELVISIPSYLRKKLGVSDVGQIVEIKRNTLFLLVKNLNNQFFSVIGLIITTFSLPANILNDAYKLKAILILLPLIVWITFSKERSKIS